MEEEQVTGGQGLPRDAQNHRGHQLTTGNAASHGAQAREATCVHGAAERTGRLGSAGAAARQELSGVGSEKEDTYREGLPAANWAQTERQSPAPLSNRGPLVQRTPQAPSPGAAWPQGLKGPEGARGG